MNTHIVCAADNRPPKPLAAAPPRRSHFRDTGETSQVQGRTPRTPHKPGVGLRGDLTSTGVGLRGDLTSAG
eukprot:13121252-Heterocapsa_arctica.AAC.1